MALDSCGAAAFEQALDPRGRAQRPGAVPGLRVRRAHRLPGRARSWCCCPATPRRWPRRCGSAPSARCRSSPAGRAPGCPAARCPVADGVVISLARLKRVLEVDPVDRRAVVEPGVTNLEITGAAAPHGLYYAPDPSSQQVCTIGGNVAENSGGAHCLKYGFTTNHVLSMRGRAGRRLGRSRSAPTPASRPGRTCAGCSSAPRARSASPRRSPCGCCARPESVRTLLADFPSVAAAGDVVSDIVAAGHRARRGGDDGHAGHRGRRGGRARRLHASACRPRWWSSWTGRPRSATSSSSRSRRSASEHGCTRLHIAGSAEERAAIWRGRKAAFAAVGRISPDYFVQDGVVPRTRLAEVLDRIAEMGDEAGLRVANVFHAGDGNLHPLVLYSAAAGETERGREAVRARSPSCAWSWAGRCRASTASAPTRRARCRRCSARTTWP